MLNQDYQDDLFQPDLEKSTTTPIKRNKKQTIEIAATTSSNNQSALPRVQPKPKQMDRNYSHQTFKEDYKLHTINKKDKSDTLQHISKSLEGNRKNISNKKRQRSLYNRDQTDQIGGKSHSKSSFKANRKSDLELRIEQKKGVLRRQLKGYDKSQLAIALKSQSQKIQKYFHQSKGDLIKLNVDEINRLNYKLRQWIVKLNNELDHKINQALRDQNTTKIIKEKSRDQLVILLQSQIVNNEDRLTLLANQEQKLRQQAYEYDEENVIELEQEKEIIRGQIKKISRMIVEIKALTGKKAGQLVHQKITNLPKVQRVKQQLTKVKGEFSKNEENLNKLEAKYTEIQQNMQRLNFQLQAKLQQAKDGNISLAPNQWQQVFKSLKEKVDKSKTQNLYLENKVGKNISKFQNQVKMLKNERAHYDRDTLQVQEKIDRIATQALSLITHNRNQIISHSPAVSFFNKYQSENDKNFVPFSSLIKHESEPQKETDLMTIKESESGKTQTRKFSVDNEEEGLQNQFMNIGDINVNQLTNPKQIKKEQISNSLRDENKSLESQLTNHIGVDEIKGDQQAAKRGQKLEAYGENVSGEFINKISLKKFRFKRNQTRIEAPQ